VVRIDFRRIYRQIRGGTLSLERATGSVFLGLFIGLLPLYGLHLPLCLSLSIWLGLDGLIAYAAANISNPLFAPFIVMFEMEVGSLLFAGRWLPWDIARLRALSLSAFTLHSLGGALLVALIGACVGSAMTYLIGIAVIRSRGGPKATRLNQAILATLARYHAEKPSVRHYVRAKLRTDPLTRQLAVIDIPLGRVTDAGCGRGQFGLLLYHLGFAESLCGFDWDEVKVGIICRAAGNLGRYVKADLNDAPLEPTDSVLMFDVLHYLSRDAQRQLFARTFSILTPGGHLLVRDIDKNRGVSATLTRLFERIGTILGVNRSAQLLFRSSLQVREELLSIGFELQTKDAESRGILDNQLWVYRKPALPLRGRQDPVVTG
jgi:uncharacterized protein (DUF2062 family)